MSRFCGGTQAVKILEESIHKEDTTRIHWYANKGLLGVEPKTNSRQKDVFKKKIELNKISADCERTKELEGRKPEFFGMKIVNQSDDQVVKLADEEVGKSGIEMLDMRPPSVCTKHILYEGFSKEGKGRKKYLLERKEKKPEEKYIFPQSSSMEYGWRLEDTVKMDEIKKPEFGRTQKIRDTFFSRNMIPDLRQHNPLY